MKETQVLIIGGGVAGTMLARELSKYEVNVTLVEKKADVSFGISKAGNGYIYSGLVWQASHLLKSIATGSATDSTSDTEAKGEKWCQEGYKMWRASLFDELGVSVWKLPTTIVATNEEELELLRKLEILTKECGHSCKRLTKDEVMDIEPNLTPNVIAGLYDDEELVYGTYPWEVVIALAESAQQNGVKILLNTEVIGFSRNNESQIVITNRGTIKADFVVNATGADGVQVAKMADACDFNLQHFKAHLIIMDKKVGWLVNGYTGILVGPGVFKQIHRTRSDNLVLSSVYTPTDDPRDLATDKNDFDTLFSWCQDVVPELSTKDIIAYHAVSRVFSDRDRSEYIVEFAPNNPKFLNLIYRMPGFIPSPAITKYVVAMLEDHGLSLSNKDNFKIYREPPPQFNILSDEEKKKLISHNPKYGHVVCRCETVTEGEIVEAIRRGGVTMDGVKFRTRAGMGRCQGGFCGPRVVKIIAKELNIHPTQVTKMGGNSWILWRESKTLSKTKSEAIA